MGGVHRNEKGMALIMTILIIGILVVITVEFGLGMRQEYFSAANQADGTVAEVIAHSGSSIAMELLTWDGRITGFDSPHNPWYRISHQDFSSLFATGKLHLHITDLSGKLQINSLVPAAKGEAGADAAAARRSREILLRLLLSGNFGDIPEEKARALVDSLVDWIDTGDRESPSGAKTAYYRSLDPPYGCKNGPVDSMEELLLVKGMTRDILYGTGGHLGLASCMTVYGNDGTININTASPVLLQALSPQMTADLAKEMEDFRLDEKNEQKLSSPTWYKEITQWPDDITFSDKLVTARSRYFLIASTGESGTLTRSEEVYVYRGQDNGIALLSRKVE